MRMNSLSLRSTSQNSSKPSKSATDHSSAKGSTSQAPRSTPTTPTLQKSNNSLNVWMPFTSSVRLHRPGRLPSWWRRGRRAPQGWALTPRTHCSPRCRPMGRMVRSNCTPCLWPITQVLLLLKIWLWTNKLQKIRTATKTASQSHQIWHVKRGPSPRARCSTTGGTWASQTITRTMGPAWIRLIWPCKVWAPENLSLPSSN